MSLPLARCLICRGLLDVEDLFCGNCGTATPPPVIAESHATRSFTHKFVCGSCGASMSYDAAAQSLRCPFCSSEQLEERQDSLEIEPQRVVRFAVDQPAAEGGLRTFLAQGFFRPSDLRTAAMIVRMTPVYVPFWVFSAAIDAHWTADTSQTPAGAQASWYPLSGTHQGEYAGLLVGASGALAPGEIAAIGPFDMAAGVSPGEVDLENVIVEQFSVPRKYSRPLAVSQLQSRVANDCAQRYIPGQHRNLHVNLMATGLTSEPVLLPVWIMAYRYRDELYRILVNGQTGRVTGRAPTSIWKVALVIAIVLGGMALLVGLAGLVVIR